jgi:hypothetical protein
MSPSVNPLALPANEILRRSEFRKGDRMGLAQALRWNTARDKGATEREARAWAFVSPDTPEPTWRAERKDEAA